MASTMDRLLRKALAHAGIASELAECAELEWQAVGFIAGNELASYYRKPRNIGNGINRHVRITWRDRHGAPITLPGPFAIGSGRYRGLGVFIGV